MSQNPSGEGFPSTVPTPSETMPEEILDDKEAAKKAAETKKTTLADLSKQWDTEDEEMDETETPATSAPVAAPVAAPEGVSVAPVAAPETVEPTPAEPVAEPTAAPPVAAPVDVPMTAAPVAVAPTEAPVEATKTLPEETQKVTAEQPQQVRNHRIFTSLV